MPTFDHYQRQQYTDVYGGQPHPGAALMPTGQQQGMGGAAELYGLPARHDEVDLYRGPQVPHGPAPRRPPQPGQHRAAAQARAYAYGTQRGRADAAAFRMQAARPFSSARRAARQRWIHEESQYIEASTFAQALTMEAAYNEFFGLY